MLNSHENCHNIVFPEFFLHVFKSAEVVYILCTGASKLMFKITHILVSILWLVSLE